VPLSWVRPGGDTYAVSDYSLQYQADGKAIMGKARQLLP